MKGRLLLVVALGLAAPFIGAGRAQAATNCPPVAGKVTVALVIDDDRSPPIAECWTVPEGTTGAQLLALRAERLGRPAPRYDRSGLLCAIDGYPTSGCGEPTGDGAYIYWSYWWRVPSGWKYATTGPATKVLRNGDVEGWHFIVGRGTGTDLAPRLAPATITFDTPTTTSVPSPTTTRSAPPLPTVTPAAPRVPTASTPTAPAAPRPSPGVPLPPPDLAGGPAASAPEPTTTIPTAVAGVTTTEVDALPDDTPTTSSAAAITTVTPAGRRGEQASPVLVDSDGSGLAGALVGVGIMAVAIPACVVWVRRRAAGHADVGL